MKASDLFVKCLENEGVKYIFGIPGEENIDLIESLGNSKIKFITTRHEGGASFMADVYGRISGKPGVCLSTLGPGATNLLTGVGDANLDRSPLVAVTGQLPLKDMKKGSHQYLDVVDIFKHVTKWNKTVRSADSIPKIIRKAFDTAVSEKRGSTHIQLPEDIAEKQTNSKPLKTVSPKNLKSIKKSDALKAAKIIEKSSNPIILAGNGVIRSNASKSLLKFARTVNIPVITTFMGKGSISAKDPLHIGTVGLNSKDYGMSGLENADLVILVGSDIEEYAPSVWNAEKKKKIIHIDTMAVEGDEHYLTSADLIGDINEALEKLTNCCISPKTPIFSRDLKKYIEHELEHFHNNNSFPMKPQKIVHELRKALGDKDILISDVGAHKVWLSRLYPTYEPNTFIVSNGMASMGVALPGSIGAKLAKPNRKIVAVCGDGGFLMSVFELETAVRLGLDLVIVVFDDQKYGLIDYKQKKKFKRSRNISFNNPDFVKLAESFGAKGYRIMKSDQLYPTLKKALNSKGVHIIDVPIDGSENRKLGDKLGTLICKS